MDFEWLHRLYGPPPEPATRIISTHLMLPPDREKIDKQWLVKAEYDEIGTVDYEDDYVWRGYRPGRQCVGGGMTRREAMADLLKRCIEEGLITRGDLANYDLSLMHKWPVRYPEAVKVDERGCSVVLLAGEAVGIVYPASEVETAPHWKARTHWPVKMGVLEEPTEQAAVERLAGAFIHPECQVVQWLAGSRADTRLLKD